MNGTCRNLYFVFLMQLLSHVVADPDDMLILEVKEKGRLEVRYKGNWGSICYSPSFDDKAANVACQQMGFRSGTFYGTKKLENDSKIVLQNVTCTGQEDQFSKCKFTAADSSSTCGLAVVVDCVSDPALDGLFDVKLIGNAMQANKGILQAATRDISKGTSTGAVCHDSGTAPEVARIVCKQLGYPEVEKQTAASASSHSSVFTATCKGTEQTLAACTLTHGTSCSSNNVIDVECRLDMVTQTTLDVRLSQSSHAMTNTNSGTVEVKKYGKWGVICDTGWDINEANVVCRQLGFKGAVPTTGFPTRAKFGQGTGIVVWNNVQCSGEEQSIAVCKHDEVFGTSACDSVNASGVICSSETLPTFDICSHKTITIPAGVSFLRSPGYPNLFDYENGTTCSCTTTNLSAATNLTVYIHQKMFQQNHVESLTFYNDISQIRLYGDDSLAGPFSFKHMDKFTIQFESDKSAGEGMLNIQIKASEPVSLKGQTTTQSTPIILHGLTTTTFSAAKYIGNSDPGTNAGVAAAVTGVVIVLIGVILGIILWRLGYIRFGRKARDSDGNGRYDVSQVANGATTAERAPENYVNVGGAYENVGEPVYVNSAFVADQPTNTSQGSSDHHTNYENMGDVAFEQTSGNTTALAEPEQGSIVDRNHGNGANNSGADEGESQYAKLEPVQRSEYADLRGITAEQF